MALKIPAHTGKLGLDLNTRILKNILGTDATPLKNLRGMHQSSRDGDLLLGLN